MALKRKYTTQEEIPAEVRPAYTARDGAFVLDVEGIVDADEHQRITQQLESANSDRKALQEQIHTFRTEEAAILEARRVGIRPGAERDLRNRARAELTLDAEGKTVKRSEDGKVVPMSVSDWVQEQAKEAVHLFTEGEGTGAAGVRARGNIYTGPNPWKTGNWTAQALMEKENPELAKALQEQASSGQ